MNKIGIDIVSIKRFKTIKRSDRKYWLKIFTNNEWDYSFGYKSYYEHLAGIFAVKEAVLKVVGNKFIGRFDLLEIIHDKYGAPLVSILGKKRRNFSISISHERAYAVAVVIKE